MLPATQKAIAGPHPGPGSSPETDALWFQWHITRLPTEMLSHIFGCLGCDDIARVHDICHIFREVVQANYMETFFYSRLPKLFRKQYLQSRLWQKRMVENGLHPFTRTLPGKESEVVNAEQHAGILCFHTLGTMTSTGKYRPVEVFAGSLSYFTVLTRFSLTDGHLLLYRNGSDWVRLVGQDFTGSWSEQTIENHERPGHWQVHEAGFSADGRYLFIVDHGEMIESHKRDPDSGRWRLINQQRFETAKCFQVSPSGRLLIVVGFDNGIESIQCFDNEGYWQPMPMAEDVRIDPDFEWNRFSPSEEHLIIKCGQKLLILSLDSHGCWHFSWESKSHRRIDYVEFCPSGRWLLLAYRASGSNDPGSVAMIKLEPAGKCIPWQTISYQYLKLTFSPAGNYLVNLKGCQQYLLWRLAKSGQWAVYGEFTDYAAPPATWPSCWQKDLEQGTIVFSSCDHYLLTSSPEGAVRIWGQDEQGTWTVRGTEQHGSKVSIIKFSQSGVHALTVDRWSARIWGRNDGGMWSVKGIIPTDGVRSAQFHPVAEHLIVYQSQCDIKIWEIQKEESREEKKEEKKDTHKKEKKDTHKKRKREEGKKGHP